MYKDFIPYEQMMELKKLGFDEPCLAFYDGKDKEKIYFNNYRDGSGDFDLFKNDERLGWVGVPTYRQAFRWFRDGYNLFLHISVDQTMEPKFCYSISKYESTQFFEGWENIVVNSDLYYKYEEAELECLKELITFVKKSDGTGENIM